MPAACLALITPTALGPLPCSCSTSNSCSASNSYCISDPYCASSIKGVVGVWLARHLGLLVLLCFQRGGLSLGQCLVMALLVLTVQVPNTCEGQLHGSYQLHRNLASRPGCLGLIQHLTQVRQLVKDGSFLLTKVRRLPRWCRSGASLGGLPLHHPFCQFGILLIDVEHRIVRVIVILLLL